jgi:hypothetical protein
MPANAGIQVGQLKIFWIPAFAGMTVFISEKNTSTPQLDRINQASLKLCHGAQDCLDSCISRFPDETGKKKFHPASQDSRVENSK